MEILFKFLERSWRSTGQHVDEPCSLIMCMNPVTNRTDSALLSWVFSADCSSNVSVRGRGLSPWKNIVHHPPRKNNHFSTLYSCGNATHVVTCSALVSGFITSPVGAHSSVNVSDDVNDFRFQRHVSSSSQLDSLTEEQLNADWLSQCNIMVCPLPPLRSCFSCGSALKSTFFILRDFIERHNNRATQRIDNEIRCQLF